MAVLVKVKAGCSGFFFNRESVRTVRQWNTTYLLAADAKESAALADRCKEEGTTPYAAMCVAFLLAFRQVNSARFRIDHVPCRYPQVLSATFGPDVMFNYAPPFH